MFCSPEPGSSMRGQTQPCPFNSLGCNARLFNKLQLSEHLALNMKSHLELALQTIQFERSNNELLNQSLEISQRRCAEAEREVGLMQEQVYLPAVMALVKAKDRCLKKQRDYMLELMQHMGYVSDVPFFEINDDLELKYTDSDSIVAAMEHLLEHQRSSDEMFEKLWSEVFNASEDIKAQINDLQLQKDESLEKISALENRLLPQVDLTSKVISFPRNVKPTSELKKSKKYCSVPLIPALENEIENRRDIGDLSISELDLTKFLKFDVDSAGVPTNGKAIFEQIDQVSATLAKNAKHNIGKKIILGDPNSREKLHRIITVNNEQLKNTQTHGLVSAVKDLKNRISDRLLSAKKSVFGN